MRLMFDAFWRAVIYCVHPRVVGLSLLPLILMVLLSFALGYFFWEPAVNGVAIWFESFELLQAFLSWLERIGLGSLRTVFAPLVVLALATPAIVLLCLLLVSVFMTPAMVELVGQRRFPLLKRLHGGSWWGSLAWSLASTLLAFVALVISMPLWLVPPLVLVLPPLIWGWLTYRVFAFDSLADHASADERHELIRRHRGTLLLMGVLSGDLGAAPSLLWASGAMFIALAPLLVPIAIWVYTLVFAFASLWFAHFCLAALQAMRASRAPAASGEVVDVNATPVPSPAPQALPGADSSAGPAGPNTP